MNNKNFNFKCCAAISFILLGVVFALVTLGISNFYKRSAEKEILMQKVNISLEKYDTETK